MEGFEIETSRSKLRTAGLMSYSLVRLATCLQLSVRRDRKGKIRVEDSLAVSQIVWHCTIWGLGDFINFFESYLITKVGAVAGGVCNRPGQDQNFNVLLRDVVAHCAASDNMTSPMTIDT